MQLQACARVLNSDETSVEKTCFKEFLVHTFAFRRLPLSIRKPLKTQHLRTLFCCADLFRCRKELSTPVRIRLDSSSDVIRQESLLRGHGRVVGKPGKMLEFHLRWAGKQSKKNYCIAIKSLRAMLT